MRPNVVTIANERPTNEATWNAACAMPTTGPRAISCAACSPGSPKHASTYPSYPSSSPLRTSSITPTAARIAVVGCRNSYPLALHLHEQLMQLRGNIDILPHPGRSLAEELGECLAGNGTDVPARIGAINDGFDMLDELGD